MLLVAGNLVYDMIAGPVEDLSWDTTVWPAEFAEDLGGNGAVTAFSAFHLGFPRVRLITACGSDAAGGFCRNRLSGVDAVYLPCQSDQTALTMGLFRADGARALVHRPGVLGEAFQHVASLRPYAAAGTSWLHVANPFAVPGLRKNAAAYLREAKEDGWTTSLDTGWDRTGEWMASIGPCLPYVDWLFANSAEAAKLGGEVALRSGGAAGVVIKRGADGCSVDGVCLPAEQVAAVDSTGAGDCFCGGFLAAAMNGASPVEAARAGNRAGALCVAHAGATRWR